MKHDKRESVSEESPRDGSAGQAGYRVHPGSLPGLIPDSKTGSSLSLAGACPVSGEKRNWVLISEETYATISRVSRSWCIYWDVAKR